MVNGLDVAGYGWSGPEKSWNVPSLLCGAPDYIGAREARAALAARILGGPLTKIFLAVGLHRAAR